MDFNPLTEELAEATKRLAKLHKTRAAIQKSLDWYEVFDPADAATTLRRAEAEIDRLTALLPDLQSRLAELEALTGGLKAAAREDWWNPASWFTNTRPAEKQRLAKHLAEVEAQQSALEDVQRDLVRAGRAASSAEALLSRHKTFDRAAEVERLAAMDAELPLRELELDELSRRTTELNERLKAPLRELKRAEAERAECRDAKSGIEAELGRLARDIAKAEALNGSISAAATSYDRAMLHKECERIFGDSSPGGVLRSLRPVQRRQQSEARTLQARLDRLDRDISKIKKRLVQEAGRASRSIKALVVDGNNLCYQGGVFIGLAALMPLCRALEPRFEVTVVFDASIRRLLRRSDADINHALGSTRIHVVASRGHADETILHAAHDPYTYILSNDRFAEYADKPAVREGRLIRHEIINGRVLVHDFALEVPLEHRAQ